MQRKIISVEDAEIWEAAAESLNPLKKRKGRVLAATELMHSAKIEAKAERVSTNSTKHKSHEIGHSSPVPVRKKPPPLAEFDSKAVRKIGSGRTPIDRRIDLHGMRQSEAHAALRRFLFTCHDAGLRMVLVITGKGNPALRASHRQAGLSDGSDRTERGVLRRSVPMWLAEPDLRGIVISYTEAAPRHGGDGALYVHLRKRDRAY